MKFLFKETFAKDLQSIKDQELLSRIERVIESVANAHSLSEVAGIKRLRGSGNYYRIRIGHHRIGFILEGDQAIFARCLHRREVYRYFP